MTARNPFEAPSALGMYFWRIENLKTEMASRPLSDREVLPYLVVFGVLCALAFSLPSVAFNVWDALGVAVSVILALFGTIYIYRENGGAQGQHFLQRYLVVGWVVSVRCCAAMFVLAFLFFATLEVLGVLTDATTWYDFVFLAIFEAFVYWRVGHHIHDLSHRSAAA